MSKAEGLGITQKELAYTCFMCIGTLRAVEKGKRIPLPDERKLFCKALECNPEYLFPYKGDIYPV